MNSATKKERRSCRKDLGDRRRQLPTFGSFRRLDYFMCEAAIFGFYVGVPRFPKLAFRPTSSCYVSGRVPPGFLILSPTITGP